MLWLTIHFFENFADFVSTMSDDEILTIWKVHSEKASPKINDLLGVIRRFAKAVADKSKEALKVRFEPVLTLREFLNLETKTT